jgi:hypothetical protein
MNLMEEIKDSKRTLKLTWWDVIRRVFCRHPWDKSVQIGKLLWHGKIGVPDGWVYTINIRRCSVCETHFIDEGIEPLKDSK